MNSVFQLDEEGVISILKTQLVGFRVLKYIYFADELSRNTMGKVLKSKLRETWKQNHNK